MIVVAIIGILAAIAIPNFTKFQAKSKQSEAKTNLKAIFTAAKSYFGEHDTFIATAANIGFAPEAGNRYTYDYNAGAVAPAGSTGCAFASAAATGTTFVGAAGGNIDTDATCDQWNINELNALVNVQDDVAL